MNHNLPTFLTVIRRSDDSIYLIDEDGKVAVSINRGRGFTGQDALDLAEALAELYNKSWDKSDD